MHTTVYSLPLVYNTYCLKYTKPPLEIPFLNNQANAHFYALTQAILALPIIIINNHFYIKGFKLIFKFAPNMDSLVSLGSSASFIYSLVITFILFIKPENINLGSTHHLYFESSVMILVLVTLGKFLEAKSKKKTGKAIEELYKFIPDTVTIEENNEQKRININELQLGQIIVVKQDEYIPVDGTVIEGHSFIDKSAITGESMPVEVGVGDFVTSATIKQLREKKNLLVMQMNPEWEDLSLKLFPDCSDKH